jgi:hypothetical protein
MQWCHWPNSCQTVFTWANEILEGAPLSVRASKQAALQGLGYPLDVALNMNYTEVLRMQHSEDTVEGPRAFAERSVSRTGRRAKCCARVLRMAGCLAKLAGPIAERSTQFGEVGICAHLEVACTQRAAYNGYQYHP